MLFYKALYGFKLSKYRLACAITWSCISSFYKTHQRKDLDFSKIRSILLLRNDGIGDMVITTPVIRALTQHGYCVSVMSQKGSLEVIKNNPYVAETFIWNDKCSKKERAILEKEVRARQFDLVIDMRYPVFFAYNPDLNSLCHRFDAYYTMGWNKSRMPYDVSINHYMPEEHITSLNQKFLEALGIHNADCQYELFVSSEAKQKAQEFIQTLHTKHFSPIVVINPYSGSYRRDMTEEQIKGTIQLLQAKYLQTVFVVIGIEERIKILVEKLNLPNVTFYASANILEVAPLIQLADLVISPDTSIVHIAAVYQKKLVALYASDRIKTLELTSPKNMIKANYHFQASYERTVFFDKPNVVNKVRPPDANPLVEYAFAPNNPNATQLIDYQKNLKNIPAQEIADAAVKLLSKK